MISFDEAVELVRSVAKPLGTERVAIADACGRVLAEPVSAGLDSPRSDASAMDGYAVRDADLRNVPTSLRVVGQSFAGHGWNGQLASGECARIFTGAPVPAGADRVVIQENVRRDGDLAIIEQKPGAARHIRKRGSDFRKGGELLEISRLLDPRAIVAAAAADVAELAVYRQPLIRILSTGDELAEPGTAAALVHAIPESVSFGVAALAEQWGGKCIGRTRLGDDLKAMERTAAASLDDVDVVVVTGGASVGEKDFAKAMFEPHGLELIFSKVSIKPGKPVWLGRGQDTLVMGLPGNPTSALVTARLLLVPLLAGLSGQANERSLRWRRLPLAAPLPSGDARETFHRASIVDGQVKILSFQDSSAQKALAEADILVRQRSNSPAMEAGHLVEALDF